LHMESAVEQADKMSGESPLSLATADFNRDGVPDLAVGYRDINQGRVVVYSGNPRAILLKSRHDAVDAPFLNAADAFTFSEPPEFLGAGDFNADGNPDLVAAQTGSSNLYWLKGNGSGGFLDEEVIPLPGQVTALVAGDVNRKDGLADLLLGIDSGDQSFLLVYEGPYGALSRDPEKIGLPGPAHGIAIGHLDEQLEVDIAVTAGTDLVIVTGRDRRLSGVAERRDAVPPARVQQLPVFGAAASVAIGDFMLEEAFRMEIAVLVKDEVEIWSSAGNDHWAPEKNIELPDGSASAAGGSSSLVRARLSAKPGDDLLVTGAPDGLVHLLSQGQDGAVQYTQALTFSASPNSIVPMRLGPDVLSDLVITAQEVAAPQVLTTAVVNTYLVDSDLDEFECDLGDSICNSGPELGVCTGGCTLNAALENANLNPDLDAIEFDLVGPHTPNVIATQPVIIDGTSMQTTPGIPVVEIDRQLELEGGSSVVRNVVVYTFEKAVGNVLIPTIEFSGAGNNLVEGCYVGTNATGTAQISAEIGIGIASSGNTIGGTTPETRNVIVAGETGVFIQNSTDNLVIGNYIGTDFTGSSAINTGAQGVFINRTPGNTVGGAAIGEGNLISGWVTGDFASGVLGWFGADFTLIQGNFIGTDATGLSALGNAFGVNMTSSGPVTLGGTAPGAGNLISGNIDGIFHVSVEGNAVIQGNLIGTDVTGNAALFNGSGGIRLNDSNDSLVGGLVAQTKRTAAPAGQSFPTGLGPRNVIVGGDPFNGAIWAIASRAQILGNYVGVGVDGNPLGGGPTVWIGQDANPWIENLLGGAEPGAGNVITGGVMVFINSSFNKIQGNYIGTDASGTASAGVCHVGVRLFAPDNLVGGTAPGEGNVISGCERSAIEIGEQEIFRADRTVVQGNIIGLDVTGTQMIGGGRHGIWFWLAEGTVIGGADPGARNIISGNEQGITVEGPGITIQGNYIGTDITGTIGLGNGSQGIYLGSESSSSLIGGSQPGHGNLVSGNVGDGIVIMGSTATGIQFLGNKIGTDISGTSGVPNGRHGIVLAQGAASNLIGSSEPGGGNIIAFNPGNGITLHNGSVIGGIGHQAGLDNRISGNSIFANGGLGIDLNLNGVNENDQGDVDAGPNNMQNFPELSAVTTGSLNIEGKLNSTANSEFTVEFFSSSECDNSGHGEGEIYLGSLQVITDSNGDANVSTSLDVDVPGGYYITATATDTEGNTSEFSSCLQMPDLIFSDSFESPLPCAITGVWAAEARDCTTEDCSGDNGSHMSWDGKTWCRALIVEEFNDWELTVPGGTTTFDFWADWGAWDLNDCGDGITGVSIAVCGLNETVIRGDPEQHFTCDVTGQASITIEKEKDVCEYVIIGNPYFY
jgi:hypothetical protein